jgi:hypothetical protein
MWCHDVSHTHIVWHDVSYSLTHTLCVTWCVILIDTHLCPQVWVTSSSREVIHTCWSSCWSSREVIHTCWSSCWHDLLVRMMVIGTSRPIQLVSVMILKVYFEWSYWFPLKCVDTIRVDVCYDSWFYLKCVEDVGDVEVISLEVYTHFEWITPFSLEVLLTWL